MLVGLLSMLASTGNAVAQDNNDYFYADVNGDGVVNIADIIIVLDCILDKSGTGDLPTPSVNPAYVSAREYGAVGDGMTDDTRALEALLEAASRLKKAAYLEPGTYLISRSLTLRTGLEIYGTDATITRRQAAVTTLTQDAPSGQMYVDVDDASAFKAGDQIYIAGGQDGDGCTHGIISRVEPGRIYFNNIMGDQQRDMQGCTSDYQAGTTVSTSFALLRSWSARYECDGVLIHDLTLNGNRSTDEPLSDENSCIFLDIDNPGTSLSPAANNAVQRNLTARHLTISNSPGSGITDYSQGGLAVTDCIIENSALHGIHLGQGFDHAIIAGNTITGNGTVGSGVCFSQAVADVVMDNNNITSFEHGCSADEASNLSRLIVRKNQIRTITGEVFALAATATGRQLQFSNNTIRALNSLMFSGNDLDGVMLVENEIKTVSTLPSSVARVAQCNNVVISSNKLPASATISTPVIDTGTTNIIQASNSWN